MTGRVWDVVVVGAGPAGALTARLTALAGCSTLLVDRHSFPRWKVCGACLNGAGVGVVEGLGLAGLLEDAGAVALRGILVSGHGASAAVPLHGGVVLSRRVLDRALVDAAVGAGARFVQGTARDLGTAPGGVRSLSVRREGSEERVEARVVVDAAGLGGMGPAEGRHPAGRGSGERIGVGAVLQLHGGDEAPGWIRMFVGRRGYVGMVTQEDGALDVAAALDRGWVREHGAPAEAAAALVREAGGRFPAGEVLEGWRGTPSLDASPTAVAGERLFRVGDAAGYVEPFTGEGMSWALWGAALLAPLAVQGAARWDPGLAARWSALHRGAIVRRQRWCRAVAWLSRRPYLSGAAIRLSKRLPGAAARVAGTMSRPYDLEIQAGPAARPFAGEIST